jgi:hypothetical protein
MKRRIHSADPYVEFWVKPSRSLSLESSNEIAEDSNTEMIRHATTIKWGMLFPLWEETFNFVIPCFYSDDAKRDWISSNPESPHTDFGDDSKFSFPSKIAVEDNSLRIIVRDAIKSESGNSEITNIQSIIGECFLDFSVLLDQKTHILWLPIVDTGKIHIVLFNFPHLNSYMVVISTPEMHHLFRSRHKLPMDCALKVEAKMLYSREILYRNKIDDTNNQIDKLTSFIETCSNELLELAYEWEKMSEKQARLEELKRQKHDDSTGTARKSGTKQSSINESTSVHHSSLPNKPISADNYHHNVNTRAVSSGSSSADDGYSRNGITQTENLSLSKAEMSDFVLLARSNSNFEQFALDDNIDTLKNERAKKNEPASQTLSSATDETKRVEENSKQNLIPEKPSINMGIFRGAGGGRVQKLLLFL